MAFRNCLAVAPVIRICLVLDACPATISTLLFPTPSVLANSFINSAFAAPSTGGEATLTFTAPSNPPANSVFEARGTTRAVKLILLSFSEMFNIFGPANPLRLHKNIQHQRLQESDKQQNDHRGNIEHPDRRDE